MRQTRPHRELRFLLVSIAVGTALSLSVSGAAAAALINGSFQWTSFVGTAALAWAVVVGWALVRARDLIVRLDRAAHEATGRFEAVAAQSRDWIWHATPEGILTYSSPGAQHLLGYEPEALIGRLTTELLAPDHKGLVQPLVESAAALRQGWGPAAADWRHADGHRVRLVGTAEPMIDPSGALAGFRGVRSAVEVGHSDLVARRERIRSLIGNGEFSIALQPIISIETGTWIGAEALLRLPDDTPEQILAEAEEVSLAEELEAAAIEAALTLLHRLPPSVYLAVNLSPFALLHPAVIAVLDRHRDELDRVVLELTEHVSISDYERVREAVRPLRRRGMRLAIDDAGAGYASFLHVVSLHPDLIKLDRALVSNLGGDPAKRAVARAICSLATELGAAVVAEGVETLDDIASAAALGLSLQQGYALARPSTDPQDWFVWGVRAWPKPGAQTETSREA